MSRTVDERVVAMKFDNQDFQKNISTTMSSLDKLKEKLNLPGSHKGLENINAAAKNVNLDGVSKGVDGLSAKFSALQIMGVTALVNITNSAVNAGKRMISALTIDPVRTGLQEYELKINAIQTIMSNTASKGTTMADVTKVLDELNTYADKTIYNFAEMTRNIGTFTAAGVGLKDAASSIQGLGNLAAASGANTMQLNTAMYQMSQALATGTVKLMDWNSVVNAGMGGAKFQEALKATAREHGIAVDSIIKKEGSFRESLKEGWLTAQVMNDTLKKFTVEGAKEYAEAMMKSGKYTREQADALIKEAQAMEDAATKVKTFTQLWDTLKEAAQSGWSKTWEIVIGDFEEAKELLTSISQVIGGFIDRSSDARNNMLQGWKDLGGRKDLIESLSNIFKGLLSVIKPIAEAFREIFPRTTAQQLYNFTAILKKVTSHLIISDTMAKNLKATFKGVFSIFRFVIDVAKALIGVLLMLTGCMGSVANVTTTLTGSIGRFISTMFDSIRKVNIIGFAIEKLKQLFLNLSETIRNVVGNVEFLNIFNAGIFTAILLSIRKFIKGASSPFKSLAATFESVKGSFDNVKEMLGGVRDILQGYQDRLKADILMKIATAIALLSASLYILSTIKPERLITALAGMALIFKELMLGLNSLLKIAPKIEGAFKTSTMMIGLSTAILILSIALKKLSTIDVAGLLKGLAAIGGLMAELVLFLNGLVKIEGKIVTSSFGLILLSTSILILANALEQFGSLSVASIIKGLVGMGAVLAEIHIFTKYAALPKSLIISASGLIILGGAMLVLASALNKFGNITWSEIGRGLLAMAAVLVELSLAINILPSASSLITKGASLVVFGIALNTIAKALSIFGGMSLTNIVSGLSLMGGALLEISIALGLLNNSLKGSASLLIASTAIAALTIPLKALGSLSLASIGKALLALAGAFTIIGVAGTLLAPLVVPLLGLAGAFALLGVAMVGIGAGLTLAATGIAALAAALSGGATAIVNGLRSIIIGFADLLPTLLRKFGEGIVEFTAIIGQHAPRIADSILQLLAECFKSMAKYVPQMADSVIKLLIGVLEAVRDNMPKLVMVTLEIIGAFFAAIGKELSKLDSEKVFNAIKNIALLTGVIAGLSIISGMIPGAMAGVVGMGIVVAELAGVLAILGSLGQIPGLTWLIDEGGNFLQKITTAIGKFIGGFAVGLTSTLPEMGENLSTFMNKIMPFIDGIKLIDEDALRGVGILTKIMLSMSAAGFIDSLLSFFTGGNSLKNFGEQLVEFGRYFVEFSDLIKDIDTSAVNASANAAKALSELATGLPNSGGLISFFVGDNKLGDFAVELIPFGIAMKSYSEAISGINTEAITASANAAKALSELAKDLPNSGGLISWITGENDILEFSAKLPSLGQGLKAFSDAVEGVNVENITSAAEAIKSLSEVAKTLPEEGGLAGLLIGDINLESFAENLPKLGQGLKGFSDAVEGIVAENVIAASEAVKALSEIAKQIPKEGGLFSLFTGDVDITSFAEKLPSLGQGLKGFSDAVEGIVAENVIAASEAVKALSEIAKQIPKEGGLFSLFTGDVDITSFAEKLPPLGRGIKGFSDAVEGVNADSISGAAAAIKTLSETVKNLPNSGGLFSLFTGDVNIPLFASMLPILGRGIKGFSDAVEGVNAEAVRAAANAMVDLSKAVKSLTNIDPENAANFNKSLVSLAKTNVDGFVNTFKDGANRVRVAVSGLIMAANDGVKSGRSSFVDAARTMMESFIDKFKIESGRLKSISREFMNDVVDTIRSKQSSFEYAGRHVADGLIIGMRAKESQVYRAGYRLGQEAVKGEKDGQQSRSPSKLTIQAGKWVGEGLIIGMKLMGKKVYDAGYGIGEMATDSIGSSISNISSLLDTNIDAQPTIRPVLDLSNVTAGANSINGMFKNPSLDVLSKVGSIDNSFRQLKEQDSANSDILSAIRDLNKTIGKSSGNTYTINGITYDDGSNITNAVEQLVHAAKIERRV